MMAGPALVAGGGMALAGIGSIVQGLGANYQGQAQAAASTYRAGVALLNKQIDQQNANWAIEQGGITGMETGLKARSQIGQTKVVQAASGLDVNSGTAQRVRDTQTTVADYDQNVIAFDAAKTAYGYESKATMDEAESNLDMFAAKTEKTAGQINMISSFINGGSNVASKWMQASQAGMFA